MIALHLDPASVRCALIGRGDAAVRRLAWLREAGAEPEIWSDEASPALIAAAGASLRTGLPRSEDLCGYGLVWIADLPRGPATVLADVARAARVLVNVEDVVALCDFHTPAVVRRGRLTLSAGTGGASPALASSVRERLQAAFPEIWGEALEEIARARTTLRAEGASFDALVADARARLAHHRLI